MGGDAEAAFAAQVCGLFAGGTPVVVVHGGGPEIDAALAEAGVTTARIEGQRVTDARTLEITERVLCGTLNKRLVRSCLVAGVAAVGLSGIDGGILKARRLTVASGDLGYVGDVAQVDPGPLFALLEAGYVPVVAPLALDASGGHALNVNADSSAGAIAAALHAPALLLVTNVPRVRAFADDAASGIDRLSVEQARRFAASPACAGSMKPKMEAAIRAVAGGVERAYIGNAPLASMLGGDATQIGTAFT